MTSGRPLRVGLIGLGDIAQKAYLPALAARADVTLTLLGRDNDRLTRIGRQCGVHRCVTRLDDLLDSGIDVAFVHASTEAHFGLVERLLSAGIHVLVGKPLAPSFADARHLVDLAERQERSLAVGFNRRFAPAYAPLAQLNRSVVLMQKNRVGMPDEPRRLVFDDFIHVVDTLRFLMPTEQWISTCSSPDDATAAEAFEASRQALGVDVIDLYLIHWPVPSQGMFVEAWLALEKIYAAGGARAIGVSNFLQNHLDTLLAETTVVPAVNQFELHPTFQQAALSARSRALEIAVEAHSPLGRGTDLNAEAVTALAQVHGATPAQIVLGWHLGVGNIVIPKSANAHRLRENLAATEIILSQNELDAVTMMGAGARMGSDPDEAAFTQL